LTLIDRTIISRQLGLAELGVYGVAAKFASIVLLVVTALQLSWQPFAYSIKDDEEARVTYAVVTSWFAAVMGWLVAGIALLAAPAVRWFTVPAYFGAAQLIPLLALASGIYGAYFLIGIGVSRVKRTGWHAAVAFGAVAVSFVANMVLVREIGVLGAAVSAVLANAALVTFMLVRAHKVFPVPYEITRLARAVGLTLIAVALAYVLPEGTDIWSVMWRVLIALSFPIILVGSGFLTEPERERIGRRLRRSRAAS
jgi:O-antigen/teichoic acid export membrane protein